jgi:hypothetical protein
VYCVVLVIKGYQMALLLLPAARQDRAHSKARWAGQRGAVGPCDSRGEAQEGTRTGG